MKAVQESDVAACLSSMVRSSGSKSKGCGFEPRVRHPKKGGGGVASERASERASEPSTQHAARSSSRKPSVLLSAEGAGEGGSAGLSLRVPHGLLPRARSMCMLLSTAHLGGSRCVWQPRGARGARWAWGRGGLPHGSLASASGTGYAVPTPAPVCEPQGGLTLISRESHEHVALKKRAKRDRSGDATPTRVGHGGGSRLRARRTWAYTRGYARRAPESRDE